MVVGGARSRPIFRPVRFRAGLRLRSRTADWIMGIHEGAVSTALSIISGWDTARCHRGNRSDQIWCWLSCLVLVEVLALATFLDPHAAGSGRYVPVRWRHVVNFLRI